MEGRWRTGGIGVRGWKGGEKEEGPCKVRNETESDRNETKQIETKRNRSKRNETNRNDISVSFRSVSFLFRFALYRDPKEEALPPFSTLTYFNHNLWIIKVTQFQ